MKNILITVILTFGILLSTFTGALEIFAADCQEVRGEVLRLHIPANSDDEADQAVKLRIRDFLLEEYGSVLSECTSLAEAEEKAAELLPEIERRCTEFLHKNGFYYSAKAELVHMYFTTREYDRLILPAGDYSALRITLGSGEGHNWWCVIFPQLCLPAVSSRDEQDESDTASEAESALDSFKKPQRIKFKFAIYEWLQSMFEA